ncbi:family 10 glycosylhydrolase [Leptolyngbya sp. FACHB-261]|uniref:family 10 glycosylhydrolase n=1 Tax=Leptolyngbya sp. FACHB-261 TaxID=2692806 RepID=UPI0016861304|nr:family 10 glycosylhydrolase [Leptolyngbya sp. FACHB-261]MBD2104374.1 family 10 glycosylhydrolase [Leptolyngbya sp. FACHB-261]
MPLDRQVWRRRGLLSACTVLTLNSLGAGLGASASEPPVFPIEANASASVIAQTPGDTAETLVLGVVRSNDTTQWSDVQARLTRTGVAYRVVEPEQFQTLQALQTLLGNQGVLFLPNQSLLSAEQVEVLRQWLQGGGRLIVSGPVGSRSSQFVQQSLRSLLGAYWSSSLDRSAGLSVRREFQSRWGGTADTPPEAGLQGGVLIPTGLDSQTVAAWDQQGKPPAVVATQQVAFLGWQWGTNTPIMANSDGRWLRAALGYFGADRLAQSAPVQSVRPELGLASTPNRIQLGTPGTSPGTSPATSPVARPLTRPVPGPVATPTASRRTPTLAELRQSRTAPTPSRRAERRTPTLAELRGLRLGAAPASRRAINDVLGTASSPSQQVQPTEDTDILDPSWMQPEPVPAPITPISPLESIALRRELSELLGRVESALVSRVASNASTSAVLPAADDQALDQARRFLQDFPKLVTAGQYAEARLQWAATRDSLRAIYPTEQLTALPEVRAIWLDRGTIVEAGSEAGLTRVFDRLAAAGVNTVFFETMNAGYPIYPSQVAPEQNPLTRGWDPLAAAVRLAHERKMELHAWVWVFAAGNDRHNALLGLPANYPGPLIARNPGWANFDNRGSLVPPGQGKPFLDPANPQVRSFLLRLFREIATNYKVDGLHLDYIRYPFQDPGARRTYGYGQAAREQFRQISGVDPLTITPADRSLWWLWTEFRTEQVNQFVAETARMVRSVRPSLILSAAVFPLPEHDRTLELQQHWETWARKGDIDLLVPMTYALSTTRLQALVEPSLAQVRQAPVLFLPSLKLLNLPEAEFIDQLQSVRDLPAGGYSLFAAAHLSDGLQQILSPIASTACPTGATTPVASTASPAACTPAGLDADGSIVPYRQPFAAAQARFKGLRREWDYLNRNNQLWIRDNERTAWREQATTLDSALGALTRTPSRANLETARTALAQMRTGLNRWMRLDALERPYRLRTWQNRLEALDALLRFGERTTIARSNRTNQVSADPQAEVRVWP